MDDFDNAETAIINNYERIDFKKTTSKKLSPKIAQDLIFIMENAALHENGNGQTSVTISSSEDSESDSSSDSEVKIVKVEQEGQKSIVSAFYEDSTAAESENSDVDRKALGGLVNENENEHEIVQKVLNLLISKVSTNCYDEDSTSSDDDDDDNGDVAEHLAATLKEEEKVVNVIPKVKNEVLPQELPEDEDIIAIQPGDNLLLIGVISAVVERMIVIEADKTAPALDAETALFLNHDTFLGKIFETLGPVKTPFYTVRLSKAMDSTKPKKGTRVYFVPFNQSITKYVFLEQLRKLKGSDASWKDDCEPPPEFLDYSDDEEERRVKSEQKKRRKNGKLDSNDNRHDNRHIIQNRDVPNTGNKKMYVPQRNPLLEHAQKHEQKVNGVPPQNSYCPPQHQQKLNNVPPQIHYCPPQHQQKVNNVPPQIPYCPPQHQQKLNNVPPQIHYCPPQHQQKVNNVPPQIPYCPPQDQQKVNNMPPQIPYCPPQINQQFGGFQSPPVFNPFFPPFPNPYALQPPWNFWRHPPPLPMQHQTQATPTPVATHGHQAKRERQPNLPIPEPMQQEPSSPRETPSKKKTRVNIEPLDKYLKANPPQAPAISPKNQLAQQNTGPSSVRPPFGHTQPHEGQQQHEYDKERYHKGSSNDYEGGYVHQQPPPPPQRFDVRPAFPPRDERIYRPNAPYHKPPTTDFQDATISPYHREATSQYRGNMYGQNRPSLSQEFPPEFSPDDRTYTPTYVPHFDGHSHRQPVNQSSMQSIRNTRPHFQPR
ncbi:RNA-binding protein 33-like isoform X2 [Hydractinia symbiolongicarpus]|uniref:RNA-binding protein 33-like isoform X2 n=1 Tax=Hydractinia symbiolongicarpus TaxID=13093 RepID=UPI00254F59E1|nr:RNA-binding protein 33-like isoform X2 [Hydractinia symbiolongicarpus]